MKKILVPTDFSKCANTASTYAIQLAQLAQAEILFLHLFSTPIDWVKLPKAKENLYPEIRHALAHSKSELTKWVKKAESSGIKATKYLSLNSGREEMWKQLKNQSFDFLVVGSTGTQGLEEKILGSNAQQIIRNASVPVLVIKRLVFNPIKNILFVSDFTDVSRASFHTLTHFADVIEAHIDLLFVNTPNEFTASEETSQNMDSVMHHCNRIDSCTRNVVNAASVEEGIKSFMVENPMDLIAICTHGKGGLRQLFSPSIAEKIVNHTVLPLLSIKL